MYIQRLGASRGVHLVSPLPGDIYKLNFMIGSSLLLISFFSANEYEVQMSRSRVVSSCRIHVKMYTIRTLPARRGSGVGGVKTDHLSLYPL